MVMGAPISPVSVGVRPVPEVVVGPEVGDEGWVPVLVGLGVYVGIGGRVVDEAVGDVGVE